MTTSSRLINSSILSEGSTLTYLDPLAQSFLVTEPSILTKVDLYFSNKDDVLPVKIDIRKMINGSPSTVIVPFSEKNIPAANILTSANSLVATSVEFNDPVFVEAGEYCLTLFSDSNKIKVWIAQLAETDVATGVVVQKQPTLGVLFKSQNGSTWTPDQLQDLKFTLYRAKFTPGQTSTVEFYPGSVSHLQILPYDPLEIYPNRTTLKVYHPNHGLSDGSKTLISQIYPANLMSTVTYYGLYPNNITGFVQTVSNVTPDSYTVNMSGTPNSSITGITRFGGRAITAFTDFKYTDFYPAISILKNSDSTVTHSIKMTSSDYTEDDIFTIVTPNKDFNTDAVKVLPSETNRFVSMSNAKALTYKIEMITNETYNAPIIDTEKTGIVLFNNKINNPTYETEHKVDAEVRLISTGCTTSFTNLTTTTGTVDLSNNNARANAVSIAKGTTLRILGANNSGNVRVLEILNNGANILVNGTITTEAANGLASSNVIILSGSKFISELAATGGSAMARYITRPLNFINPSTAFKFFLDVSKPVNTDLKFYFRTSLVGETSALSEKEFTEITNVTMSNSLGGEFYEIEKLIDNLENFDGLQFKIVFLSDDITKVPKCRNLRLVAIA